MNDLYTTLGITIEDYEDNESDLIDKYEKTLTYENKKGDMCIDENVFARYFVELNHLSYHNGLFFNKHGKISEDIILQDIWGTVEELHINTNVGATCEKIIKVVRIVATKEKVEPRNDIIPFSNGDLYIKEKVFRRNHYCDSPYRFSVPLMTEIKDAPYFSKWLHDLLEEDDIIALQMFLGLCLTTSQKAQKSFYLVGQGGAGKSVLGKILQTIIGNGMISTPNTQDFVKDKFKVAELENKIVLYDDDMDDSALENTGLYKKIITNELYITADRKYGQPFEFKPQAKVVACTNNFVVPASDTTDGFYRRLHPILIKPTPDDFKPDKDFYDKIVKEIDYITWWAIQGLYKLIDNNWVIPESDRTRNYITIKKLEANPLPGFMEDTFEEGDTDNYITSTDIYSLYKHWCHDNGIETQTQKRVISWLSDNSEKYHCSYSKNIPVSDGKHLRGFRGLKRKEFKETTRKIRLYVGAS